MDELFALLSDDEGVEGGQVGYGHEADIDVGREDTEEGQEQDEDIGPDFPVSRPVKRSRSGAAVSPRRGAGFGAGDDDSSSRGGGGGDLHGRGGGGGGSIDEHEHQEVIEIFSDDDDAQPLARRSRQAGNGLAGREVPRDGGTAVFGGTPGAASGHGSSEMEGRGGGFMGYRASPAPGVKHEPCAMATGNPKAQKPAALSAATSTGAPVPSGVTPPFKLVGGVGGGGGDEGEGKPSAREKDAAFSAAAEHATGGSGWLGGLVAAAKAATSKINSKGGGQTAGPARSSSSSSSSSSVASGEFPLNLECAMCFNPLAVAALFACGHGSCWECAQNWCSRDTSATMDCPTCHVSVPRNDFRRCVVLDQVVDRAVLAAGMDDDEWRARLERGQELARGAEARRRDSRDAQRTAEETIAKQAAELKRLKEEAKEARSRGGGGGGGGGGGRRSWRSYEQQGLPPSMADYGFRLMSSGGRDLDPASQRSAIEELTRFRHRRAEAAAAAAAAAAGNEPVVSSRNARAAGDAAAAAAAAYGMPSSAAAAAATYGGGGGRQRGSVQSGFGVSEGDPWFSLRPSHPSRQPGMAMPGGRVMMPGGRMVRTDSLGRSDGNSAAAAVGLEQQAAGAALKSAHGLASGGSNWRSAYLNAGRMSMSAEEGGRTRGGRTSADTRGGGHGRGGAGAAFARGMPPGAGKEPAARQTPPSFFGGAARSGPRDPRAAAVASSPYLSGGGVGLAAPPGSQYDTSVFVGPGLREQPSRAGGGGGSGGGGGRQFLGHATRTPAAPALDLDELIMSGPEDSSSRSEWDDVLAAVSLPTRPADEGLGRADSPDTSQG